MRLRLRKAFFKGLLKGDEALGVLLNLVGSSDDGAVERSLLCRGFGNKGVNLGWGRFVS